MKNRAGSLTLMIAFAAILLAGLLALSAKKPDIQANTEKIPVTLGQTEILAEIADTQAKRTRGLSGKPSLAENEGMLFIFEEEGIQGFWMRDMNFSIDIVWIGADKSILGVSERVSPDSYPKVFRPESPVKYVLEVPAGFFSKHSLDVGEKLIFEYKNP